MSTPSWCQLFFPCCYIWGQPYISLQGCLSLERMLFVGNKSFRQFVYLASISRFATCLSIIIVRPLWPADLAAVSKINHRSTWSCCVTKFTIYMYTCLMSIAKEVFPTDINQSRPLIPDGIISSFWTGKGRLTYPYMLIAMQGCIWYHFYCVFCMILCNRQFHNCQSWSFITVHGQF